MNTNHDKKQRGRGKKEMRDGREKRPQLNCCWYVIHAKKEAWMVQPFINLKVSWTFGQNQYRPGHYVFCWLNKWENVLMKPAMLMLQMHYTSVAMLQMYYFPGSKVSQEIYIHQRYISMISEYLWYPTMTCPCPYNHDVRISITSKYPWCRDIHDVQISVQSDTMKAQNPNFREFSFSGKSIFIKDIHNRNICDTYMIWSKGCWAEW